jgi:hypothetical protein
MQLNRRSQPIPSTFLPEKSSALQGVIEHLVGGVLILTAHQELI